MIMPSIYELEQRFSDISGIAYLEKGGQKTVFSGNHCRYGPIVLKLTSKMDDRTRREIDIVTTKKFPCVPVLFDWGNANFAGNDVWYLIEERIRGKSLRTVLQHDGPLNFDRAIKLLEFLLQSATRFESESLVHRDIKPENVMVADDGRFLILDFGIAKAFDLASLTATAARFGPATIGYAAPEQFRNMKKQLDSRADLFSIGIVFYECITGSNPFIDGTDSPFDVIKRSEALHVEKLRLALDQDSKLADFIDTLMQKWPSRRPRTAAEALLWYHDIKTRIAGE